ncbi:MAG: DUF4199 family protein [Flavobacteriales bacterium]|nr:DUF4199 family protein [Flavobacteriales bacterium]
MANIKPFIKFALLFSLFGIAVKIILWQQGLLTDNPEYAGMSYLLFLMFACFFSIYEKRKHQTEPTKFAIDYKYGMKSVAIMSLVIALFTYGFYELLDPEDFPNRIAEKVAAVKAADASAIESPMNLTKEQTVENNKRFAEFIYNSANHAFISLFAFLILGGIYSSIITWLVRKVS